MTIEDKTQMHITGTLSQTENRSRTAITPSVFFEMVFCPLRSKVFSFAC